MPCKKTVIRWLADPRCVDFREDYYHARRVQAELRVDEIFEIADDNENDYKLIRDDVTGEIVDIAHNHANVQRAKLRIDTRKWYAAKLLPRVYGERFSHDLDVTGDLAEILRGASNNSNDLPEPIDVSS